MQSSSASTGLSMGLAALGLGLVVAGVRTNRRKQAGRAAPAMAAAGDQSTGRSGGDHDGAGRRLPG